MRRCYHRTGTQVGRWELSHGSRRSESDALADIMEGCEHHSCRREKWTSCALGTALVGRGDISSELPAEVGARVAASEFNTKALGKLVIYTGYVVDPPGPVDGNLIAHSKGHQRPWFAVGDFNMAPFTVVDLFESIGTQTAVHFDGKTPICNAAGGATTYDLLMLSPEAAHLVETSVIAEELPSGVHRPVRFRIRIRPDGVTVPVRRRPVKLPIEPVVGPRFSSPGWRAGMMRLKF